LSVSGLRSVDEAFGTAALDGIPWIVLASKIRVEEPTGLQVIQAVENRLGSVQRLTSEVALINRVCSMISNSSMLETVGLDGLKSQLMKQAPHLTTTSMGSRPLR
jgi:hypothetical protein